MNIANFILWVSALLFVIAPGPTYSQADRAFASLMVSRDADGTINKESKKAIHRLSKIAKQNGHVRVWVTLDTPFDPFLVQSSGQQAADQQQRVDQLFDEVLGQLLSDGLVRYPTGERVYAGPSIMLMVTDDGLKRLANNLLVGQLVGIRE